MPSNGHPRMGEYLRRRAEILSYQRVHEGRRQYVVPHCDGRELWVPIVGGGTVESPALPDLPEDLEFFSYGPPLDVDSESDTLGQLYSKFALLFVQEGDAWQVKSAVDPKYLTAEERMLTECVGAFHERMHGLFFRIWRQEGSGFNALRAPEISPEKARMMRRALAQLVGRGLERLEAEAFLWDWFGPQPEPPEPGTGDFGEEIARAAGDYAHAQKVATTVWALGWPPGITSCAANRSGFMVFTQTPGEYEARRRQRDR